MIPLRIKPEIILLSITNKIVIIDGFFFQENLRQYVDRIFTVITKSGVSCPTVMCDIFFSLRESAAKRFQGKFQYIILLYISGWCCVGAVQKSLWSMILLLIGQRVTQIWCGVCINSVISLIIHFAKNMTLGDHELSVNIIQRKTAF